MAETLSEGDSGDEVIALQTALNAVLQKLDVDGDFGSKTTQRVKQFQREHHLTVDGIFGPATRAALLEAAKGQ